MITRSKIYFWKVKSDIVSNTLVLGLIRAYSIYEKWQLFIVDFTFTLYSNVLDKRKKLRVFRTKNRDIICRYKNCCLENVGKIDRISMKTSLFH